MVQFKGLITKTTVFNFIILVMAVMPLILDLDVVKNSPTFYQVLSIVTPILGAALRIFYTTQPTKYALSSELSKAGIDYTSDGQPTSSQVSERRSPARVYPVPSEDTDPVPFTRRYPYKED